MSRRAKAAKPRPFHCPSCGTESDGLYCRRCGEKKVVAGDHSLRHYLDVALDLLTHWDSKGLRTLWLLLRRPGFLSAEYFRGSRVRYLKPLQLFLALNVVYYFSAAQTVANTFTTPLALQLGMNDYYASYAHGQVDRRIAAEQTTYPAFAARYDAKTEVLSKTLIFFFIPLFALLFALLFLRSGRSLVEHAVVATHFWSFNLVLLGVLLPLALLPFRRLLGAPSLAGVYTAHDALISAALQVGLALYLYAMLRPAYGARRWYRAVVALAIGWSFFHLVWLYRFLLFEVTLRSI